MVPVGEIAIMSDPFADKPLSSGHAGAIMTMFWEREHKHALGTWADNLAVVHLNQNIRSGKDRWFSELLDSCRLGRLHEDDYNFPA